MALKRNHGGFTLIETIVVLFIITLLVNMGGVWAQRYSEHQLVMAVAEHQKAVAGAANHFIRDNYTAVLNRVTGAPVTIGLHELTAKGLLPSGFSNTNAFKQSYRIVVIKPQANQLKTMIVTEGGDVIPEGVLRKIVRHLGAAGGRISNLNAHGVVDASLVGKVQGIDEGWTEPLSPYGVSPGVGHLASAIFHQDGQEVENYLHRKSNASRPELNGMETALNMGGHNINGVNVLKGQSAELAGWVTAQGGSFREKVTAPHLEATTKVTAPSVWGSDIGGNNAAINGALTAGNATVHGHGSMGSAGIANNLWAGSIGSNAIRSNGRLATGEFLQLEGHTNEGWGCSPNGLVGRNGSGALLMCESGTWKKAGGASVQMGACQWVEAPSAYRTARGYKTAVCPPNFVMTGTRWYQIPSYVDDEHVDAYCCPLG